MQWQPLLEEGDGAHPVPEIVDLWHHVAETLHHQTVQDCRKEEEIEPTTMPAGYCRAQQWNPLMWTLISQDVLFNQDTVSIVYFTI